MCDRKSLVVGVHGGEPSQCCRNGRLHWYARELGGRPGKRTARTRGYCGDGEGEHGQEAAQSSGLSATLDVPSTRGFQLSARRFA